jgi:hypothetical protein
MKLSEYIILESRLKIVEEAGEILSSRYSGVKLKKILNGIEAADPYRDKRFAKHMAHWIVENYPDDNPLEFKDYIVTYKELIKKMDTLWKKTENKALKSSIREMQKKEIVKYGDFLNWLIEAERIVDENYKFSEKGLKVVATHGDYTMYEIRKEKDLEIDLVKRKMPWCVVRHPHFGGYGGPPYYAIMKGQRPICMVCPGNIEEGGKDYNSFANELNSQAISYELADEIKPLLLIANPKIQWKSDLSVYIHLGLETAP